MSLRAKEVQRLLDRIKCIHTEKKNCYGSPRIYVELREQGERCGRKRIFIIGKDDIQH